MELAVLNPTAVLGPAISEHLSTSMQLILQPLRKALPAFPRMSYGVVDVRDVARAHVEAMERPEAAGQRFLLSADVLWLHEIGAILARAYPERKLPRRELPSWLVRMVAKVHPMLRQTIHHLDRKRTYANYKAQDLLGIDFIAPREAILASAASLIKLGAV